MNPSPAKRWTFRFASLLAAVGLAMALARGYDALRHDAPGPSPRDAFRPRPGETLRMHCQAFGDDCRERYGAELRSCYRRSCRALTGFETTPQGFAGPFDREYAIPAGARRLRMLAVGGSTTAHDPWPGLWPTRLEARLDAALDAAGSELDVEVLNLALSAARSADWLPLYETIGRPFAPDVLLVGEEVNDLGHCEPFASTRHGAGTQLERIEAYMAGELDAADLRGLSPWIDRHLDALAEQRRRLGADRALDALGRALTPRAREAAEHPGSREFERRCVHDPPLELEPPTRSILLDFDEGFRHTRARIEELVARARADGVRWIAVTTTPHAFEHYACPTPSCPIVFGLDDWRAYITEVHNPGIRRMARELDLLLVDLERALDDEQRRALFLEWMHPSPAGHERIAAVYARVLGAAIPELPSVAVAADPPA